MLSDLYPLHICWYFQGGTAADREEAATTPFSSFHALWATTWAWKKVHNFPYSRPPPPFNWKVRLMDFCFLSSTHYLHSLVKVNRANCNTANAWSLNQGVSGKNHYELQARTQSYLILTRNHKELKFHPIDSTLYGRHQLNTDLLWSWGQEIFAFIPPFSHWLLSSASSQDKNCVRIPPAMCVTGRPKEPSPAARGYVGIQSLAHTLSKVPTFNQDNWQLKASGESIVFTQFLPYDITLA